MSDESHDRQTAAMHRLLAEAAHGGQAKVDALLALMQRTVFVVPWPTGVPGYRTLVNASGVAALPIFTDVAQLETASRRFGWLAPDGAAPSVEVGARQALTHARQQALAFVVVDVAAEHGLEVGRDEFEPLVSTAACRESQGPFAGAGRISSTLMRAVRPGRQTPTPGSVEAAIRAPTPPPGSRGDRPITSPGALEAASRGAPTPSPGSFPASRASLAGSRAPSSFPPPGDKRPTGELRPARRAPTLDMPPSLAGVVVPSEELAPPGEVPPEDSLQVLEALLRAYPEVEWGCIGASSRGDALGLRIDPRIRGRVDELAARVATEMAPRPLPVVLLDEPQHQRAARTAAFVFYPWRR